MCLICVDYFYFQSEIKKGIGIINNWYDHSQVLIIWSNMKIDQFFWFW